MTERLGPPDKDLVSESPFGGDSGYNACQSATGYPCHDYLRWVSWDNIGIHLQFSDVTGEGRIGKKGAPNLRGYAYSGGDAGTLATEQGVTIGWTVSQLQALGDVVTFGSDSCAVGVRFSLDDMGLVVWGDLDGPDADVFYDTGFIDPEAPVVSIGGGPWSSC